MPAGRPRRRRPEPYLVLANLNLDRPVSLRLGLVCACLQVGRSIAALAAAAGQVRLQVLAHAAGRDGAHDGGQRRGLRVAQQRPQQRALHHQLRLVLLAGQAPREAALQRAALETRTQWRLQLWMPRLEKQGALSSTTTWAVSPSGF